MFAKCWDLIRLTYFVGCLQDPSQASIPYCRRDDLRNQVKKLKASLDKLDRDRKAAIMTEV